jgi:hypothetical protein
MDGTSVYKCLGHSPLPLSSSYHLLLWQAEWFVDVPARSLHQIPFPPGNPVGHHGTLEQCRNLPLTYPIPAAKLSSKIYNAISLRRPRVLQQWPV